MAVSIGFNIPIGSGSRVPTGNVNYNGAGFDFNLSGNNRSSSNLSTTPTYNFDLTSSRPVNTGNVTVNSSLTSNSGRHIDVGPLNVSPVSDNTSSSNGSNALGWASVFASILGSALNYGSAQQTNSTNQSIANFNLEAIERANRENIAFQKEENAITRSREDNAYQRAAKDLELAGLSKTLAAGSPASAAALSAPSVSPETNQFQYQDPMARIDLANTFMSAARTMSDIENNRKLTNAQVANLNANARYTNIGAQTLYDKNKADIDYTTALASASRASSKYSSLQSYYLEKYGDMEKLSQINKLTSEIAFNYSGIEVNDARIKELSQNVLESISRTHKMYFEEEKLLADITYTELQGKIASRNLEISDELNLRTTDSLPTMLGFPIGGFGRGWNKLWNWAKVYFKHFIK